MTDTTQTAQPSAQPEQPSIEARQPNQFDVQGDGVTISFSASSIAAVPLFNYQDAERTINRRGDEIRTEETEFATLVTIDVENIPDAREVTATLFVPRMVVPQGQSAPLTTIGVLTTSARRIEGQMQTYRVLNLSGTASSVEF